MDTNNRDRSMPRRVSDFSPLPKQMLAAVDGYENMPLVSIEEAVKPLVDIVPKIERNVYIVKQNCENPKDGLTTDESASIMLYTYESMPHENSLYVILNQTLRSTDRKKLIPWFLYLRLVLTALARLPSDRWFINRGIREDLHKEYPEGSTFIWWAFSSCTSSIKVLESDVFFGKDGTRTLFQIDCHTGKNIKNHSFIPTEDEILLLPARQFKVESCLDSGNGLYIIQLKELRPPHPLLEPVSIPPRISTVISCIIWLDAGMKDRTVLHAEQKLSAIINHLEKFQDVTQCQKYIEEQSQNDRLVIIVSGRLGREIVPSIHNLQQVMSIYVYCMDRTGNEQWACKYEKIKAVVVQFDELISRITTDHGIEVPLKISQPLTDINVLLGQNGMLSFTCDMLSSPKVTWFFNDTELKNSTKYLIESKQNTFTLTVNQCDHSDAGIYHAQIQNDIEKIKQTAKLNVQTHQKLAASGAYPELPCSGHRCATCTKCNDWYYAGDRESWQWMLNFRNWKGEDKDRWCNGDYYHFFKLRDGATCNRSSRYLAGRLAFSLLSSFGYTGVDLLGHICVCVTE